MPCASEIRERERGREGGREGGRKHEHERRKEEKRREEFPCRLLRMRFRTREDPEETSSKANAVRGEEDGNVEVIGGLVLTISNVHR